MYRFMLPMLFGKDMLFMNKRHSPFSQTMRDNNSLI